MIELLRSILGILGQYWEYISAPFVALGLALSYFYNALVFLAAFSLYLPPIIYASVICVVVFGIIKFILAR